MTKAGACTQNNVNTQCQLWEQKQKKIWVKKKYTEYLYNQQLNKEVTKIFIYILFLPVHFEIKI